MCLSLSLLCERKEMATVVSPISAPGGYEKCGKHIMRFQVKGAGLPDTREVCWKFFIDRVRKQLKVVLCFSPVGSTLRVRSRKFPALINCTSINWFHEWPQEALVSVAMRFLEELPTLPVSYPACSK